MVKRKQHCNTVTINLTDFPAAVQCIRQKARVRYIFILYKRKGAMNNRKSSTYTHHLATNHPFVFEKESTILFVYYKKLP